MAPRRRRLFGGADKFFDLMKKLGRAIGPVELHYFTDGAHGRCSVSARRRARRGEQLLDKADVLDECGPLDFERDHQVRFA
jgi:hypothetical protein